jgi:hypothetical protein
MATSNLLFVIPPEIWLNIMNYLSEPDFLSLKLSTPYLRDLITENASTICNNLIMTHYAREASIIGTTFQDGWLVPTHPAVVREEKQLVKHAPRSARSRALTVPPRPLLRANVRTKLSEPGPQYLRFLSEYSFEIRVASTMFMESPGPTTDSCCCTDTPQQKFDRWIALYTIRRFLARLQKVAGVRGHALSMSQGGEQECAMVKGTKDGLAWFYV